MHRTVIAAMASTVLFAVTACGGGSDESKDAPTGDPTTAATTAAPETAPIPDDVGGIVSGTPKDLKWRVPDVPSTWTKMSVGAGEAQWQIGSSCVVSLFQPAGLGTTKEPTQDQVLDKYADQTDKSLGTTVKASNRSSVMFPLLTGTKGVTAKTKVSRATLDDGKGVQGQIYAYRSGDFALVLITLCGRGTFTTTDVSDFQPFISKLAIAAEY